MKNKIISIKKVIKAWKGFKSLIPFNHVVSDRKAKENK